MEIIIFIGRVLFFFYLGILGGRFGFIFGLVGLFLDGLGGLLFFHGCYGDVLEIIVMCFIGFGLGNVLGVFLLGLAIVLLFWMIFFVLWVYILI